ncbi:MAG: S8 family serine peptidase [Acidobacteria bacterium]|nr:S8 family serine peptidase [Acidobacteriota bacterium]
MAQQLSVAAGNFGSNETNIFTEQPNVMVVAASTVNSTNDEIRAQYSNYGSHIDFCAPSDNLVTGRGITCASRSGEGNLPGNPDIQTSLESPVSGGTRGTPLHVIDGLNHEGYKYVLIGGPGENGTESQEILSTSPGVINVSGVNNNHVTGTLVTIGVADYLNTFGGTSSAAALAAGIAALCLSMNPGLCLFDLRDILRTTADKIDLGNSDPIGSWGSTSGGSELFSQFYGWGRLNAGSAVIEAESRL